MKVKILGNGLTWTKRPNTHFLVDEKILIDTPMGCTKEMYESVDFDKIECILITHFHQDHFTDLNVLFDIFLHRKKKVALYAPRTALSRLLKILKLTDNKHSSKKYIKKVFDFVVVKPYKTFSFGDYTFKVFPASHKVKYAFSYLVCKDKNVGFSGDTANCEGFKNLVDESDVVFVDTSGKNISSNHLSVPEVVEFQQKFPNKKFYSIHVTDEVYNDCQDLVDIPKLGEIVEI